MRAGIDIGGTFTDLVVAHPGGIRVAKVPSTPRDPSEAFASALARVDGSPDELLHGTTVATNAVLTRSGARIAFVASEGFRHLLHLARQDRPSLYDLRARPAEPLVPLDLCVDAHERLATDGSVVRRFDAPGLRADLKRLRDVDGVAIVFLHSYANPEHERAAEAVVREVWPDAVVSASCDVLPEMREYERASTTVLNAYVQPVLSTYLSRVRDAAGPSRVGVMWSGGGVRSIAGTIERPVHTLLSGPAAGVLGAAWIAERAALGDIVTLDMGGTSADVAIVDDGKPLVADESSLDGLPFRTPCLDVVSVGAGGGSIGWVDEGGALRVGPRSAGAEPGPACYGRGGTDATVTDAHMVLGHLGPDGLAGGEVTLDPEAARKAIDRLGGSAGLEPLDCAAGMLRVVRAKMARAIRSVSIERGKDLRRYALVAFGGAGPLHATALARELGMATVLIPPAPGTLAAFGLLVASRRAEASVSKPIRVGPDQDGTLDETLRALTDEVVAELEAEGLAPDDVLVERWADCRYVGQSHELRIPVMGRPSFADVARAFHDAHRARYGFARDRAPVEAVTFRAAATGPPGDVDVSVPDADHAPPEASASRRVGRRDVPVYRRERLGAGARVDGPALIVEVDSTTWIEDGLTAEVHVCGALVIGL